MVTCPICFKEHNTELFKCECGYQRMKKYDEKDYLFEIYKFSKNVFNNTISFDNAKLYSVENEEKENIYEIIENNNSVVKVDIQDNKYSIADEGILSCHLNVKSLLINVDEIRWNILDEASVKMLFIGSKLKKIDGVNLNHSYLLRYIEVDKENKYFSSENNVLFDKEKTCLLNYASMKKEEEYHILSSVKKVVSRAFYKCENLKTIYVSKKVKFEENAIFDCPNLKIVYI